MLVDHTRVLDFDVKRRYFRQELEHRDEGIRREDLAVPVRREHVFEDSYRELHRRSAEEWKHRFYIVFEGEQGAVLPYTVPVVSTLQKSRDVEFLKCCLHQHKTNAFAKGILSMPFTVNHFEAVLDCSSLREICSNATKTKTCLIREDVKSKLYIIDNLQNKNRINTE